MDDVFKVDSRARLLATAMHNPTRRVKRFKRPPIRHLPLETSDTIARFNVDADVPASDESSSTRGHDHGSVRHRPQPDALVRGVVLVALVAVTFVLYVVLWELEHASFVSVPKPSDVHTQSAPTTVTTTVVAAAAMRTRYPPAIFQDGLSALSSSEASTVSGDDERVVQALSSGKPGRTVPKPNAWPPPVTRVPGDHDTNDDRAENEHQNENTDDRAHPHDDMDTGNRVSVTSLDAAYCHGACRFLLPARIAEQESKARMHFAQLLMLARRLNRTIVLPHVGKSRMSACSKWPFDAYYDTSGLSPRGGDSLDSPLAMDLERFAMWIEERPTLPSSFVVSMASVRRGRRDGPRTPQEPEDAPFIVDRTDVDPKMVSCLESRLARLRASLPETALSVSFHSGTLKMASDASTRLLQLLSSPLHMDTDTGTDSEFDLLTGLGYNYTPQYINASSLSLVEIDVLVVDYDLRHPLFAVASIQPSFNLHYSPVLYDLADRLADNLGPFLGVHWRMETVPVQNLAWCAAALVSTLRARLQDVTGKNFRHVWLATDHPRPLSAFMDSVGRGQEGGPSALQYTGGGGPTRKSSTFTALSSEHDDAVAMLAEAFQPGGDLDGWTLTGLAEQLRRYPYVEGRLDVNETLLSDPGVFGILDKLVIVQASVFVSGSTDCSKTSSFSKQVVEARQESFEAEQGKGALRNVVEYFGQW